MLNVIAVVFANESEGYQAITALRNTQVSEQMAIIEMVLVKNEGGRIAVRDGYRNGGLALKDASWGGLIGSLIGIVGGPVGVLLGGAFGAGTGGMMDMSDAETGKSIIENVAEKMYTDTLSLIILAEEEKEDEMDHHLEQYDAKVLRFDAAMIAEEVKKARELSVEMDRQARLQLREKRKEQIKAKEQKKIDHLSSEAADIIERYEK